MSKFKSKSIYLKNPKTCDLMFYNSRLIWEYDEDSLLSKEEDLTTRMQTIDECPTGVDNSKEIVPMKFDYVMDNEDLFLLSFAPNMTRMTTKQNAMARIRILEELFKLEFEDE